MAYTQANARRKRKRKGGGEATAQKSEDKFTSYVDNYLKPIKCALSGLFVCKRLRLHAAECSARLASDWAVR